MVLPSPLVFASIWMWMVGRHCDLRWMRGPGVVVAAGDGETHCSKVRSDVVRDGPSLRSQTAAGPCGLSSAGARDHHPYPVTILVCAFGEQRRSTSPYAPRFAEPSQRQALRYYPSLSNRRPSTFYLRSGVPPSANTRTDQADSSSSGLRGSAGKRDQQPLRPSFYWGPAQPVFSPQRI